VGGDAVGGAVVAELSRPEKGRRTRERCRRRWYQGGHVRKKKVDKSHEARPFEIQFGEFSLLSAANLTLKQTSPY
jgi:hypothetical protein